jgi:hypothetical protein
MLKLNAGFSRKVGEPNYGSRGASVNVELEVESGLITDPDALMTRIRNLFGIAKRSVDAELGSAPADTHNTARTSGHPGSRRPADGEVVRYATTSQVRAIRAICNRQGVDPIRRAADRFQVNDLEELTLREASSLIDELKSNGASRPNGGGR